MTWVSCVGPIVVCVYIDKDGRHSGNLEKSDEAILGKRDVVMSHQSQWNAVLFVSQDKDPKLGGFIVGIREDILKCNSLVQLSFTLGKSLVTDNIMPADWNFIRNELLCPRSRHSLSLVENVFPWPLCVRSSGLHYRH